MTDDPFLRLLRESLPALQNAFQSLPSQEPSGHSQNPDESFDRMAAVLGEVAARMADNYPYFHPLYAGQMLKPPHPVARAA
jgi:tyrosine decarboxylase / aspartate 1-decarboxylase